MVEDDKKAVVAEINQLSARYGQAKRSKRKLEAFAAELGITDTANATVDDVYDLVYLRGQVLLERLGRLQQVEQVAAMMKMIEADGELADAAAILARLASVPGYDTPTIEQAIAEIRRRQREAP